MDLEFIGATFHTSKPGKLMLMTFRVRVFKAGQKDHYSWTPRLLVDLDGFRVTWNSHPRDLIHHSKKKVFSFSTDAMEFFWEGLPFSVGLSHDPQNDRIRHYCNLHLPCHFEADEVNFIDLDIDVIKINDEAAELVDEDEFEEHQRLYNYSDEIVDKVPRMALALARELDSMDRFRSDALRVLFARVHAEGEFPEDLLEHYRRAFDGWPQELRFEGEV